MRMKNNVHSNSVISNIYIKDEILLFDFQIAHLARLLNAAATATTCYYNVTNLVEPWSIQRSHLTRGVYFHHSD